MDNQVTEEMVEEVFTKAQVIKGRLHDTLDMQEDSGAELVAAALEFCSEVVGVVAHQSNQDTITAIRAMVASLEIQAIHASQNCESIVTH